MVRGLTKFYGSKKAVDQLSFDVPTGALFAFLGENGAGKTTTISCLTAALPWDEGEIAINGRRVRPDSERVRRDIGVVFQDSVLDPLLSAEENLRSRVALYGLGRLGDRRIRQLCALMNIREFQDRPYGKLSGGQKRRVDVARALAHDPSVLFLDEPTAGLDPKSREQMWELFHALRAERDLTIFLTTHYLQETESADRIVVVDRGRKVAEGTPADLMAHYSRRSLHVTMKTPAGLAMLLGARRGPRVRAIDDRRAEVGISDAQEALRFLASIAEWLEDFEYRSGTMDDAFIALTDRPLS
ncbi:MAG: ABC transporter ATP-binding protein [Frankiaceae bacterium]|jgi:multidrug/hemolysin transport system ATP-binding protein|nr:ABC transporter ATP-binding protein [Frankiaceae bacterium]